MSQTTPTIIIWKAAAKLLPAARESLSFQGRLVLKFVGRKLGHTALVLVIFRGPK